VSETSSQPREPYLLRPARPEDLDWLVALTYRLGEFPLPPWRTGAEIAEIEHEPLARAIEAPNEAEALLLAEDAQGTRLGYIHVVQNEDFFTHQPCGHLSVLAVDRGADGRGVGAFLVAAAEGWTRQRGLARLTLNVWMSNQRARALYERLGFTPEVVKYARPVRRDA
jgi:ribosomal protein S18 acetylase RimI-like enzyme